MLRTKRTKMVERVLGQVGVAAAISLLFFSVQGCANLPFGHNVDPPAATADVSSVSSNDPTAASSNSVTPGSGALGGSLAQTTTLPGDAPETSAESSNGSPPMRLGVSVPLAAPATQAASATPSPHGAVIPVATTIPLGAAAVVNAEMNKFTFHSDQERVLYQRAAARFPNFCNDWQRMLHDRETNNLQHLIWQSRDGAQTSTYTGYGRVETCETKESVEGIPIGKISYEEMIYYLAGKSTDEARHTPPKVIRQTRTLEIFSWEKDKWFY